MESIVKADTPYDSALKVLLNTFLSVDENAGTSTFPNLTVIKADFEGEVHFDHGNGLGQSMTMSKVNEMVNQAFKGDVLADLWENFKQDSTLQQVKNLKVWVIINDVNELDMDTSHGSAQPSNTSSNSGSSTNILLKIAAIATIVSLVLIFSISSFTYLQHFRAQKNASGVNTKGLGSTEESVDIDDDRSVFSTEYWNDAWAQAATQVKPWPPCRQQQFKQRPSSIQPNLDSIVEEEEKEEEEDWDDSSWAIEDALDGANIGPNDDEGEELSAIEPAMLEVEMDAEASCSSQSSKGSFFWDKDPEIMEVLEQKQSGCLPAR